MRGLFILSSVLIATLGVSAAPLPPNFPLVISSNGTSDSTLLLANARLAQDANRQHRHTDATAALPCGENTNACVAGDMAECVGGVWKPFNSCTSAGLSCFFLPDPAQEGVVMSCIDEPSALAVFEKAGATGGFLGVEGSGTPSSSPPTEIPPSATASISETSPVTVVLPTEIPTSPPPVVVTQTVTQVETVIVELTTTIDITVATETISPEDASTFTQTLSSTPASSAPAQSRSASASQSVISLSAIPTAAPSPSSGVPSSSPQAPSASSSLVTGPVIATLVPASIPAAVSNIGRLMADAVSVDKALSAQTSSASTPTPSAPAQPGSYY